MSAPSTAAPDDEPQLSKAELRRRRILAKRGTRMALVTGDQTLVASDSAAPPVTSSTRAQPVVRKPAPEPATVPETIPTANAPPIALPFPEYRRVSSNAWRLPHLPALARSSIVVLCGLSVPFVRARAWERASALQLFMGIETLIVAPELISCTHVGLLGAAVGVAKEMAAVWRDATLFLFALFVALRAFV